MKAVNDGYKKRSMIELELEVLNVLRNNIDRPVRCGWIGEQIFKDHVDFYRGSAPFARIAGKITKRLEKKGFAKWSGGGWMLTEKGKRFVMADQKPEPSSS